MTVNQWAVVMKLAESSGLGKLVNCGKQDAAFEFAVDVPASVESPGYLDWHNKLMQLCATSAEEYANHRLLKPDEEPPLAASEEPPEIIEGDTQAAVAASTGQDQASQSKRSADQTVDALRTMAELEDYEE